MLVEVKIRSRTDYGTAAEAVGFEKSERLRRAARALVQKEPGPVRIDVVAGCGQLSTERSRRLS